MSFSSPRSRPWQILGLAGCLLSASLPLPLPAADWPHWLGINGDNIAPADDSFNPDLSQWQVAWKAGVGLGYSSVAVAKGRAFTLGHDGTSRETVYCFDAKTGEVRWKHSYAAKLMPLMHPGGPNATPTILEDKVITISKDGQAFCLSADKGTVLWSANVAEAAGIKIPQWGFAGSPVIQGHQVLFNAGKAVALDLATGKLLWTSKTAYLSGYTTIVKFDLAGKKFLAALDGRGLSILTDTDGAEIARHPFKANYDMTATTPIVLEGGKRIFISSNSSAEMLAFDGQALSSAWTSTDLKNSMNNSVLWDGVLYGIDGKNDIANSRLVSVNAGDGKVNWARDNFGFGSTIGVGKVLLALTEDGELVTVQPGTQGYREISRLQVLGKVCWTPPVYANQRIYVRNNKGDVACLALK